MRKAVQSASTRICSGSGHPHTMWCWSLYTVGGVAKYLQMKLRAVKNFYPDWALHRDWDRQGSCACANGDSAEIEKQELCSAGGVSLPRQGVLGSRRHLVKGVLCIHGWDYQRNHSAVRGATRSGRRRGNLYLYTWQISIHLRARRVSAGVTKSSLSDI